MTHSGTMKLLKRSPVEAGARDQEGVGGGVWGGRGRKVTPHQGTIFTTCLCNTRPIYSCQIFSQRLPHTVAPSQTQASDGTGGFTLRCAAKGNTPYPLAFSCANPTSPRSSHLPPVTHITHLSRSLAAFVYVWFGSFLFPCLSLICFFSYDERREERLNPVFVSAWLCYKTQDRKNRWDNYRGFICY